MSRLRQFSLWTLGAMVTSWSFVAVAPAANAANTIAVTNTNASGLGSLANALVIAQPGDTVQFDAGLTGTVTPTDSFELGNDVTINGPSSGLVAVSGTTSGGIFSVDSNVSVSISHLTLKNASSEFGAALYVPGDATATLSHDTFSNDVADASGGAVQTDGTTHSTDDTFSNDATSGGAGDGGAIGGDGTVTSLGDSFDHDTADGYAGAIDVFEGSLTVTDDSFTNDSAPAGGAIDVDNGGTANVSATSFTNDSATGVTGNGGAISVDQDSMLTASADLFASDTGDPVSGLGGGVYDAGDSAVHLTNDTFTADDADGGGAVYDGPADGGAVTGAGVSIVSSTLADNTANVGPAADNQSGSKNRVSITGSIVENQGSGCAGTAVTNGGGNVEDGTTCGFTGNGENVPDTAIALQPLADNGGPTHTMAITENSLAKLLAPGTTCPSADQRGEARPHGTGVSCDAGAYELTPVLASTVVTNTNSSGFGSLADIVANSQAGSTVTFQSGLTGTISVPNPMTVAHNLSIDGPGGSAIVLDGGGDGEILEVDAGVTATASGLEIQNGGPSGPLSGRVGAVTNSGTLTLTGDTFTGDVPSADYTEGNCGPIANGGILVLRDSTFTANHGPVCNFGQLTSTDNTYEGFSDNNLGAALDNSGQSTTGGATARTKLYSTDDTFENNQAVELAQVDGPIARGGAIGTDSCADTFATDDTFVGNTAETAGGAIATESPNDVCIPRTVAVNDTFEGNSATTGGAISDQDGCADTGEGGCPSSVTMQNDTFSSNSGGALSSQLGADNGSVFSVSGSILVAGGCSGTIQDGGGNVAADSAQNCGFGGPEADVTGNKIGLQALADNGGPTQTMAIGTGSVADLLVAGSNCPTTDERGVARPHADSDKCDAGAFEYDPVPARVLTVNKIGAGRGSILGPSISCGSACTHGYPDGTVVRLTAHPQPESKFVGWGGACAGTAGCSVTMDGAKAVTASFALIAPPTTKITHEKRSGRRVSFTFKGSGGLGTLHFMCRVDSGGWTKCTSPKAYTVKPGRHRFEVYAVDKYHRTQTPPSRQRFTIR